MILSKINFIKSKSRITLNYVAFNSVIFGNYKRYKKKIVRYSNSNSVK